MVNGARGKGRRRKGIRGEREVHDRLVERGFAVRGLEGKGDQLALKKRANGLTLVLHVEVKRQETLRMDLWSHQAEAEAPIGAIPMVVYRRNDEPWRLSILLDDFLGLV